MYDAGRSPTPGNDSSGSVAADAAGRTFGQFTDLGFSKAQASFEQQARAFEQANPGRNIPGWLDSDLRGTKFMRNLTSLGIASLPDLFSAGQSFAKGHPGEGATKLIASATGTGTQYACTAAADALAEEGGAPLWSAPACGALGTGVSWATEQVAPVVGHLASGAWDFATDTVPHALSDALPWHWG